MLTRRPLRFFAHVFVCAVLFPHSAPASAAVIAQSGPAKVSLVEIFSSEGCSSCPPAEEWLSRFVSDPRLWKDYVPAVFHVDYWDDRGWKDRFARPEYTRRQKEYAKTWGALSLYTPGVVLNGAEWQDWPKWGVIPEAPRGNAGTLSLDDRGGGLYAARFEEGGAKGGVYILHAALLGFGVRSDVKAGENEGRSLVHNFIVLDYARDRLREKKNVFTNEVRLHSTVETGRRALVMWVTREEWPEPVQAAGTFLK